MRAFKYALVAALVTATGGLLVLLGVFTVKAATISGIAVAVLGLIFASMSLYTYASSKSFQLPYAGWAPDPDIRTPKKQATDDFRKRDTRVPEKQATDDFRKSVERLAGSANFTAENLQKLMITTIKRLFGTEALGSNCSNEDFGRFIADNRNVLEAVGKIVSEASLRGLKSHQDRCDSFIDLAKSAIYVPTVVAKIYKVSDEVLAHYYSERTYTKNIMDKEAISIERLHCHRRSANPEAATNRSVENPENREDFSCESYKSVRSTTNEVGRALPQD